MENPRVWFKSISLENVRSFGRKQTIYFTEDGTENGPVARWNVILGDNGTGKTTVLKGLMVIVQSQDTVMETGVDLTEFWRFNEGMKGSRITGQVLKGRKIVATGFSIKPAFVSNKPTIIGSSRSKRSSFRFLRDYEIDMSVYAYNASRRISLSAISEDRPNPITTFFNEETTLTNAEEWLIQADYLSYKDAQLQGRYEKIHEILLRLFGKEVSNIFIESNARIPKVLFATPYGNVRLHDLSLGYKTLIAWTVDFAKGLLDRYPDSPNPLAEPAVCLVDEIDLHLHPKFQRNIIKFLTETFPNTQFIVTAHSPLVVQAAEDFNANLIVLKREGNETIVTSGLEVRNWRVDQILSSDLFEGIPSRAPEAEERMQRRRELLLKDNLSEPEQAELEQLEEEFGGLSSLDTRETFKALDLIYRASHSE